MTTQARRAMPHDACEDAEGQLKALSPKSRNQLSVLSPKPGFYWMYLEKAIGVYHSVSPHRAWHRSWLPIFANGGGDFYVVICDPASPFFGEVALVMFDEIDHLAEFKNVSALFETIERCFARKIFFIADGYLREDGEKSIAIAYQVQPDFTPHDI